MSPTDFETVTFVAEAEVEIAPAVMIAEGRHYGFVYNEPAGRSYKLSDLSGERLEVDVTDLVKNGRLSILGG